MLKTGIDIVCSNIIKIVDIEEIFFGIEEEGVPYILKFLEEEKIDKEFYIYEAYLTPFVFLYFF